MKPLIQLLSAELKSIESLLDSELQEESDRMAIREKNARLLEIMLENPELPLREVDARLSSEFGTASGAEVLVQLLESRLKDTEERVRLCRKMRSTAVSLLRLIQETSDNPAKDYDNVAWIALRHFFPQTSVFKERRFEGKLLLLALCRSPLTTRESTNPEAAQILSRISSVAKRGSYYLCRETARRIVFTAGQFYGLTRRRTAREKVETILQDMEISRDVDDLRATLFIVQRDLSELKDGFETELSEATLKFIHNFFSELNSPQSSHLLDTVAQTQHLIRQRAAEGKKLPSELKVIPMVLDLLLNALRSHGLEPIEQVGNVKKVSREALAEYEFMGSEYPTADAVRVVVRTPGWRVGSVVISKPRVQQVAEKSHR
jgi:hypothetical protein